MRNITSLSVLLSSILLASCVAAPSTSTNEPSQPKTERADRMNSAVIPFTGTGALPERLLTTGILEIGNENAPMILFSFTNHSCRYCAEFEQQYLPRLTVDFIRTGHLKVQVAMLKLQKYPSSQLAATAVLCAAEQGKGLPMHAALFATTLDRRSIVDTAERLTLNTAAFGSCLDEESTKLVIDQHQSLAQTLGVEYVPTFFYNGEKAIGLPAYADMRGRLETLKK